MKRKISLLLLIICILGFFGFTNVFADDGEPKDDVDPSKINISMNNETGVLRIEITDPDLLINFDPCDLLIKHANKEYWREYTGDIHYFYDEVESDNQHMIIDIPVTDYQNKGIKFNDPCYIVIYASGYNPYITPITYSFTDNTQKANYTATVNSDGDFIISSADTNFIDNIYDEYNRTLIKFVDTTVEGTNISVKTPGEQFFVGENLNNEKFEKIDNNTIKFSLENQLSSGDLYLLNGHTYRLIIDAMGYAPTTSNTFTFSKNYTPVKSNLFKAYLYGDGQIAIESTRTDVLEDISFVIVGCNITYNTNSKQYLSNNIISFDAKDDWSGEEIDYDNPDNREIYAGFLYPTSATTKYYVDGKIPLQDASFITYDYNGGEGTKDSELLTVSTYTFPLASAVTAPQGKKLLGWYCESKDKIYNPGTKITLNTSTTIKAIWCNAGSVHGEYVDDQYIYSNYISQHYFNNSNYLSAFIFSGNYQNMFSISATDYKKGAAVWAESSALEMETKSLFTSTGIQGTFDDDSCFELTLYKKVKGGTPVAPATLKDTYVSIDISEHQEWVDAALNNKLGIFYYKNGTVSDCIFGFRGTNFTEVDTLDYYSFKYFGPGVYAVCILDNSYPNPNSHTISFEVNGHTNPAPIIQNAGTPIASGLLPHVYQDGYYFSGWDQLLPEVMPDHDITFTGTLTELKDVPGDLSVTLDDEDVITITSNNTDFIDALVTEYDSRYCQTYFQAVYLSGQSYLLKEDNTTDGERTIYHNHIFTYDGDETIRHQVNIIKTSPTEAKVTSEFAKSLVNKETKIMIEAAGYEQSSEFTVTFTKLEEAKPADADFTYNNGVLKITSDNSKWLDKISYVHLYDPSDFSKGLITIANTIGYTYIKHGDGCVNVYLPSSIYYNGQYKTIEKNTDYRFIASSTYDHYASSSDDWQTFSVNIIPSDYYDTFNTGNTLSEFVTWLFKCQNGNFIIESTCDSWLDKLENGDIGITLYPSNTQHFAVTIKNNGLFTPIKRGNGCVTISDADLKACGIYKGIYNCIYFDETSEYVYPDIRDTYSYTNQSAGKYYGIFNLTLGKTLNKMPTITLSEGENGSLDIYSSDIGFLNNLMYVSAESDSETDRGLKTFYPFDITDNTDNRNNHISGNTLNIPSIGLNNGDYTFYLYSYGYTTNTFDEAWPAPRHVTFNNITLADLPQDIDIVTEGNQYCVSTSDTNYINAFDTYNASIYSQYEYYKYSPNNGSWGMGSAGTGSTYFFDMDYYSRKVSDEKAKIGAVSSVRTQYIINVPGYKSLTKVVGTETHVLNSDFDNFDIKNIDKRIYIYADSEAKITSLLNTITYSDVTDDSVIGGIYYGSDGYFYYDSTIWNDGYIDRNDLTTGSDTDGYYICIDLTDHKFFNTTLYKNEIFYIVLYIDYRNSIYSNATYGIQFCINKDEYFINYHDSTYNTFMSKEDYPFTYVGKTVELVNLYNKDYLFDGWYTKDGTGNDWGEKVTSISATNIDSISDANKNINLYAKWSTVQKNILTGVYSNVSDGATLTVGDAVLLFTDEAGAEIRFTKGTTTPVDPTESSDLYTSPIVLDTEGTITIKANVFEQDRTSPENPLILELTVEKKASEVQVDDQDLHTVGLWTSDLDDISYDPSLKQFVQSDLRVYSDETLLTEGVDYTVKYANNKKVGTASLTVTGKGNYAGTLTKNFDITPIELTSSNTVITLNKTKFTYNGKAQKPSISSVIYIDGDGNSYKLKNNTDYVATIPTTAIDSDDYSVTIQGKGNYYTNTDISVTYTITPKTLATTFSISGLKGSYPYTGSEIKPDTFDPDPIVVKQGKNILVKDTDYEVSYENNIEIGTATIKITGIGTNYEGELTKTFKITGTAISTCKVTGFDSSYVYNDQAIEPDITVTNKAGDTLTKDTDYEVEYQNNNGVGTATILITGKGGYTGTLKKTFKITGKPFNAKTVTVSGIDSAGYTFTGSEIKPSTTLTPVGGGDPLEENTDYEVTYKANINAGTATVTYKGIGKYTGSFTVKFKINKATLLVGQFSGLSENQEIEYSKGGVKPVISSTLVLNKDYTVKYTNNTAVNDNSNPKKITSVVLTGKGNYQGTVTIPFKIVQKDISKVTITVPDKAYSGKVNAYKSTVTLVDSDGKKLAAGTDYDKNIIYQYRYDTVVIDTTDKNNLKMMLRSEGDEVRAKDIVSPGAVIKVIVKGVKNYKEEITATYRIANNDISKASVTVKTQYFTGKPIYLDRDDITVKMGGVIIDSSKYNIISYTNNINKGTATAVIEGVKDYGGTKEIKFTIANKNFNNIIRFHANTNDAVTGTMKDMSITKTTKLTKNTFKCAGKTFVGWSTDSGAVTADYDDNDEFTYDPALAGIVTDLYAVWQ